MFPGWNTSDGCSREYPNTSPVILLGHACPKASSVVGGGHWEYTAIQCLLFCHLLLNPSTYRGHVVNRPKEHLATLFLRAWGSTVIFTDGESVLPLWLLCSSFLISFFWFFMFQMKTSKQTSKTKFIKFSKVVYEKDVQPLTVNGLQFGS